MIIFGAGYAGLIAANMLRRFKPVVYEKQKELPHNHEAVLRFRSDIVSQATGIPFQKVKVSKAVYYKGSFLNSHYASLRLNNEYSFKVSGQYSERSIGDLQNGVRWIAPDDFAERLAAGADIEYGREASITDTERKAGFLPTIISTLPMPVLIKLLTFEGLSTAEAFRSRGIVSVWAEISDPACNLYQTIYYPSLSDRPYYRATLTGNRIILEFGEQRGEDVLSLMPEDQSMYITQALDDFGLGNVNVIGDPHLKVQAYGKILPINEQVRREIITTATDSRRVYSLGRFACWRQETLLDDIVQDVRRIETMIEDRSRYNFRLGEK